MKQSAGTVPGSSARIEFYEFKNISRTPFWLRIPDSAPAQSLRVDYVDTVLKRVKAVGIKVINSAGEPVNLWMSHNAFMEALKLVQRRRSGADTARSGP